jgi:hypothetical protein
MSEKYKLKYEVIAILKENIQKGLESFGLPITQKPGDHGWIVMESDQPKFQGADNAVLFYLERTERIGWQGDRRLYNSETGNYDVIDYFIEQQHWKIKVICKRTTEKVTDDNIPVLAEDVTGMLIAWFNRLGCIEFRKHNMANLFIQMKDVRVYKDRSDVPQWTTEFPLKLQVIKQFETEIGTATPQLGGIVGIEGRVDGGNGGRRNVGSGFLSRIASKIRGIFKPEGG